MNKFRLFVKNFLIYGFGSIVARLVPLIMVPIVISIMPSSDFYGIHDLSITLISLTGAFALMGMYDAMCRMFFEKDDEEFRVKVCSTALVFTVLTSAAVFVLMILFKDFIAKYFFENEKYAYVVYLSAAATISNSTNSIISAPTRMLDKGKVFLVTNLVSALVSYGTAIPMLLAGYYVIAMPVAVFVSGLSIEVIFYILNRSWFRIKMFDKKLLKEMLVIALPLFPNAIVYWLFNSSDKLMITNMISIGAAGIYGIGSKFGYVSHLIYSAFNGGWQFFAFSTMKEKDQVKSNSLVFEYLGALSCASLYFVCALSYPLFRLFKAEYLPGYIVVPYLYFSPLLQMLFQVAGNQFLVIKKTLPNLFIMFFGAVLNIFLNYQLIPLVGIEGAAIATLCGYVISLIICTTVLCRMKLMKMSWRFLLMMSVTAGYFLIWRFWFSQAVLISLFAAIVLSGLVAFLYREELRLIASKVKIKLKQRRGEAE